MTDNNDNIDESPLTKPKKKNMKPQSLENLKIGRAKIKETWELRKQYDEMQQLKNIKKSNKKELMDTEDEISSVDVEIEKPKKLKKVVRKVYESEEDEPIKQKPKNSKKVVQKVFESDDDSDDEPQKIIVKKVKKKKKPTIIEVEESSDDDDYSPTPTPQQQPPPLRRHFKSQQYTKKQQPNIENYYEGFI